MYNNKIEYAEMIRETIMPQMVVKEDDKLKERSLRVPSVGYAEQFKMGN